MPLLLSPCESKHLVDRLLESGMGFVGIAEVKLGFAYDAATRWPDRRRPALLG